MRAIACWVSSPDQLGDSHAMRDPPCCKLSPWPGRGRVKGEQRQRPCIPGRDMPRRLGGARRPAERWHLPEDAPDGPQILDELVGDEQRLAVEALDQLLQPLDLQVVDEDRIVVALAIEEAVGDLRQLAGRDHW